MAKQQRYRGAKRGAKRVVRGRKSVGRRRQSVRQQSKGQPKRQLMQSSLGGMTMTRFVAARKPVGVAASIKRVGQPNFINITYPGPVTSSAGQQGVAAWYLNAGNDLRRIWASIQSDFVKRNTTSGAEYVTDKDNQTVNPTFRYVLETATSLLNIANTTGTPVNMELYDIVAKRDSPQVPTDFGGAPATGGGKFGQSTLILDPAVAWKVGMANERSTATGFETAAVDLADASNLGATPYQSKLFKDYFKVVRKSNITLPIGGQHKHYVDLKPNAVIDNDMLQQNQVYKGLSFFTLIVVSGVPTIACPSAVIDQPLRNPAGDVNTSAVSVSIIQQVRYKWTWVEDSRENIYRASYINTLNGNFQSIQPSLTKIVNCEVPISMADENTGLNVFLPSGCTRLDASGNLLKDCGCDGAV